MGWHCRDSLPGHFPFTKATQPAPPRSGLQGLLGSGWGSLHPPHARDVPLPCGWHQSPPHSVPPSSGLETWLFRKHRRRWDSSWAAVPHPPTCTFPSGADIWGCKSSRRTTVAYLSEKGARKAGGEQTRERHSLCSDRPLRECHLLPASPATTC